MTAATARAGRLAGLPPVGLEELNATAELLVRTDRKYVVPLEALDDILDEPGVRVLDVEGRRTARYASSYLDTPDLASWSASARARRRRWKVRTRLYADTGECWLEVKTRGARGATVKERLPYDVAWRDRVRAEAVGWVAARLASAGAPEVLPHRLGETLRTEYDRATLLLPDGAGRATIDFDLAWTRRGSRTGVADLLVVETKSAPGPAGPLDRRLWSMGRRPVRLSKYGTGLALLDPALPANRWHRVIQRDLAPSVDVAEAG